MAKATEYNGSPLNKNGIQPRQTPDGKAGHEPTGHERLRLMYRAGQDPDSPDIDALPDPVFFEGNEPLPPGLKVPRYATPSHPGAYVEDK